MAHGIGGVRDLAIPYWLFFWAGAVVLVLSFLVLGALWKTPQLERRLPFLPELPPDPLDAVRNREPRVQHAPDVSEHHLQRHEPDPEEHVDEGGCDVLRRGRLADERGQEDEDEEPGRDRAEDPVQDGRTQTPLEPCG